MRIQHLVVQDCLESLSGPDPEAEGGEDGSELDRFQYIPEKRADVDPQRKLMSAEVNARVQDNLEKLTPRERLVFEMRHFQGMRLKSIGESLGVTEEAAKNCLFRATQKMRTALGDLV